MSHSAPVPPFPPSNKLAVWALVLGIAGLVLSLFFVGALLGLVAVVLGIIAVTRPGGKGKSIAGIVMGTVSLPVALIALAFWAGFLFGAMGRANVARRNGTLGEIGILKDATRAFELDNGRFPTTAEGLQALIANPGINTWTHRYLDEIPTDKWGHPFIYKGSADAEDGDFDIISAGPDGIFGTTDDIGKYTHN